MRHQLVVLNRKVKSPTLHNFDLWVTKTPSGSEDRRWDEVTARTEAIFARVRTRLEQRGLLVKFGTIVDATVLAASGSTMNANGKRDPEMHATSERRTLALRHESAHRRRCQKRPSA